MRSDFGWPMAPRRGTARGAASPIPFGGDSVCSSGVYWHRDDDGDPRMFPGRDCIGCHDAERAADPDDPDIPDLLIAGTVYATGHEPDNCYGETDLVVVVQSLGGEGEVSLTPGLDRQLLAAPRRGARGVRSAVRGQAGPRRPRTHHARRSPLGRVQLMPHARGHQRRAGPCRRAIARGPWLRRARATAIVSRGRTISRRKAREKAAGSAYPTRCPTYNASSTAAKAPRPRYVVAHKNVETPSVPTIQSVRSCQRE